MEGGKLSYIPGYMDPSVVTVTAPEGVYRVLVNPSGAPLRADGLETTQRAAVWITKLRD